MTHSSLPGDVVELNEVLDDDHATDLEERRQRDRRIGRTLQHLRKRPVAQIRAWLQQTASPEQRRDGARAGRIYHALCATMVIAGLLTGWGLASAVLYYDGQRPINVVNAVVVLVLPQILLLLVWLVTALPVRLPLLSNIGASLGFLNPGRLAARIAGLFTEKENRGLDMLWSPDNVAVLAPAARWLLSFWSQLFAFSFNIGALAAAIFLVSFSDLAFVWSTTLDISNEHFHRIVQTLSAPWSALLPAAVPDLDLVTASRYYRLDPGSLAGGRAGSGPVASELGQWWPFLIAAIACYGLLPRLATLIVSWTRLRHHLRTALCNLPGAPELLARMNSPLVSTAAEQPEHALQLPPRERPGQATDTRYSIRCPVINWSGAADSEAQIRAAAASLGIETTAVHPAGGRQTTLQDQELLDALCRSRPEGVAILVKAWEPPLLDFLDFLRVIRKRCDKGRPVIVLLDGGPEGVGRSDRETWELTLGQLADPDLHVEVVDATA